MTYQVKSIFSHFTSIQVPCCLGWTYCFFYRDGNLATLQNFRTISLLSQSKDYCEDGSDKRNKPCAVRTCYKKGCIPRTSQIQRAGADPGFYQGGAQIVTGLNCQRCAAASCERSEPFSAWGPGPPLGPQKLLGISLLNMHSLHFGVPFYTIFEIIKY